MVGSTGIEYYNISLMELHILTTKKLISYPDTLYFSTKFFLNNTEQEMIVFSSAI